MSSEDKDCLKMWTKLNEWLCELNENQTIDVKLLNQSFDNKIKEVNRLIKHINKSNERKDKLNSELATVEKAIIKANSNITKAEDKSLKIQDYIEKLMKKSDENKENVENVMNVWNTIGLRVEKKDQMLNIKFNKISETDPNKWFSVEIKLENNNKIKIIECLPKDSLDSNLIEEHFNRETDESKLDLRYLIAFIHFYLKTNNSKK